MKLIKLYIFIVLVCLFFGVGNAYNHKLEDFKIDEVSYEEELKEEKIEDESESLEIKEQVKDPSREKQSEEKTSPNNSNSSSNSKSQSNTSKKAENPTIQHNQSESAKTESGVVDSNGNNIPEEHNVVVDKKPWEKAGVSEYDWYHKPVHSWMRVDYSVHTCGSISNCEALCMNDAEELSYTENVSCIQVYTYSGSYLGEMLKRQ